MNKNDRTFDAHKETKTQNSRDNLIGEGYGNIPKVDLSGYKDQIHPADTARTQRESETRQQMHEEEE